MEHSASTTEMAILNNLIGSSFLVPMFILKRCRLLLPPHSNLKEIATLAPV